MTFILLTILLKSFRKKVILLGIRFKRTFSCCIFAFSKCYIFFLLKKCDAFMKTQILKKHVIARADSTYLLCAKHCSECFMSISLHNGIVIPILHMRRLRHTEVRCCTYSFWLVNRRVCMYWTGSLALESAPNCMKKIKSCILVPTF